MSQLIFENVPNPAVDYKKLSNEDSSKLLSFVTALSLMKTIGGQVYNSEHYDPLVKKVHHESTFDEMCILPPLLDLNFVEDIDDFEAWCSRSGRSEGQQEEHSKTACTASVELPPLSKNFSTSTISEFRESFKDAKHGWDKMTSPSEMLVFDENMGSPFDDDDWAELGSDEQAAKCIGPLTGSLVALRDSEDLVLTQGRMSPDSGSALAESLSNDDGYTSAAESEAAIYTARSSSTTNDDRWSTTDKSFSDSSSEYQSANSPFEGYEYDSDKHGESDNDRQSRGTASSA